MKDGFADSPLRLNRMLAKLEHWNETEIKNRAEALANIAVKVWLFPSVSLYHQPELDQAVVTETHRSRHAEYLQGETLELFESLRKRILNLDVVVREEFKKHYIAYKTTTNFVDIVPQRSRLRLVLNMRFDEINDPKLLCRDLTNVRRWGNGDVEVSFSFLDQLDDVMFLVRQAFSKYSDEFDE